MGSQLTGDILKGLQQRERQKTAQNGEYFRFFRKSSIPTVRTAAHATPHTRQVYTADSPGSRRQIPAATCPMGKLSHDAPISTAARGIPYTTHDA